MKYLCALPSVALAWSLAMTEGVASVTNSPSGVPGNSLHMAFPTRTGINQLTHLIDAVVVDNGPMVHTAQILAWGPRGEIVGTNDAARQTVQVLDNIEVALYAGGGLRDNIVKLNVCLAKPELLPVVRESMARKSRRFQQVAMSFHVGNLAERDALVAMDAVAVAAADTENHAVRRVRAANLPGLRATAAAVLPGGGRYYISSQGRGASLPEATRMTLESLESTLKFLELGKSNIVQMKVFLDPITAAGAVQADITTFFVEDTPAPLVFVESHNPAKTPLEIEMIAADNKPVAADGNSVEFLTPPGFEASHLFSRVAHVTHGKTIYFSGLYGSKPGTATKQVNDIYIYLDYLLQRTRTDFNHLVKATYFVTDAGAGAALDDVCAKFYNPQMPPAASRAMVGGVGYSDRDVEVDMIGVTP